MDLRLLAQTPPAAPAAPPSPGASGTVQEPPAGPAAPSAPPGAFWIQMMPLVLIFAVFWFLVIRPQKKKEQTRQAMLSKLKKNDRVYTSGGIYGTIVGVREHDVVLRVDDDNNTRIRVSRQSILGFEGQTDGEEVSRAASMEASKN